MTVKARLPNTPQRDPGLVDGSDLMMELAGQWTPVRRSKR